MRKLTTLSQQVSMQLPTENGKQRNESKAILENSLEVTVSEWNSNLEDIEENIMDAIGWKALDIANAIKQGAKTVRDLFDSKSLSQVRQEKQAEIDNIAITIPQLVSERDEKEKVYEQAKIRYQSFQHLCSGCNNLIDELSQEGHRLTTLRQQSYIL